jgi:DNA-3-methyladenine glycosylase I
MTTRCKWPGTDPQMLAYHDEEWGVPVRDDRQLFGKLVLDGFQAGLSWATILHKRDAFLRAFDGFDPERMARYDRKAIARILKDPGIVRNRQKVHSAVGNARAFLKLVDAGESFSDLLWGFVGGKPLHPARTARGRIPAKTKESEAMSEALVEREFRFVGPTICYAFMQAVGMVNDHVVTCFRYLALSKYSPERGSTRTFSPGEMKSGT